MRRRSCSARSMATPVSIPACVHSRSRRAALVTTEDTMRALSRRPLGPLRQLVLALSLAVATIAAPAGAAVAQEQQADIVDTAVAAGSFTTLATALQAAGLVDTLKGAG